MSYNPTCTEGPTIRSDWGRSRHRGHSVQRDQCLKGKHAAPETPCNRVDVIYKIWKKYEQARTELWILYVAPTHITGYHTSNAGNIGKKNGRWQIQRPEKRSLTKSAYHSCHSCVLSTICGDRMAHDRRSNSGGGNIGNCIKLVAVGGMHISWYILIYPDIDKPLQNNFR